MEIEKLTPERAEDFLRFFDGAAFADHEEWAHCYCIEGFLEREENERLTDKATRREMAKGLIETGVMQGYLAYEYGSVVGWCNANEKQTYRHIADVKEFVTDETNGRKIKSIWCFLVAAPYRGKGIADRLLRRVVKDAEEDGYDWIEAYPFADKAFAFQYHGTTEMYERNGFALFAEREWFSIMRKRLSKKSL